MRLSYLVKLAAVTLVLGFLPLQSAFAGCGCSDTSNPKENVEDSSNALTQQAPEEPNEEDQIL